MDIEQPDYAVKYDDNTQTIICSGSFRLTGSEYAQINDILNAAADAKPPVITLDLSGLRFLNSSGINTLSKFVIRVRKHNVSQILVKGNNIYPWQKKSLTNLQRILPTLQLQFE